MRELKKQPTFPSLNKPLTILGLERRLFFSALIIGSATFTFFSSLAGGILMFALLFLVARELTTEDPEMLRILVNATRFRLRYDAAKRKPYQVRVRRHG